jgi:hypothetical protein
VLPPFDEHGNLPAGIHPAPWPLVVEQFGWNAKRRQLLRGLLRALKLLYRANCRTVYLNGSFVTNKEYPNDFDACWSPVDVDWFALEPPILDFSNQRRAQKQIFGGELFPADAAATADGTSFTDFFQTARGGGKKGIVALDLQEISAFFEVEL